jgi:hypothetical protein
LSKRDTSRTLTSQGECSSVAKAYGQATIRMVARDSTWIYFRFCKFPTPPAIQICAGRAIAA